MIEVKSLMFLIGRDSSSVSIFACILRWIRLTCISSVVIASLAASNGTRYGQMYMFAMNEMPLPGFASRTMPISASIVASVDQVSV